MLESPAVKSRHTMDDFEKPQVSMNFGNDVYIFWVLAQTSKSPGRDKLKGLVRRLIRRLPFFMSHFYFTYKYFL